MFKNAIKWVVVGFIGLIALVLIIASCAPGNSGDESPSATTEPTNTPAPTNTPMPTPTVPVYQPCPTEQEETYLREVDAIGIDLNQSILDMDAQTILAGADLTLLLDKGWIEQTVRISFDINAEAQRFRDIFPVPDSLRHIHSELEILADQYDEYVDLYMRGVDLLEGGLISTAGTILENAAARAYVTALAIERFQSKPDCQ